MRLERKVLAAPRLLANRETARAETNATRSLFARSLERMRRAQLAWFATASTVASLAGCNMITGADSFEIEIKKSHSSGTASTGSSTGGTGAGTGGGLGVGGANSTNTDATGVSITEIDFYQGVKSKVMANGAATTPTTRLVAGRPATVRVWTTVSGKSGGAITARFTMSGHTPIEVPATNVGNSNEASLASTTNFQVPAADMTAGSTYQVEFLEDSSTSSSPSASAHFPASGGQQFPLETGYHTHVTIVPVAYAADGSNRKPDTSAGQIQAYSDAYMAMYPTTGAIVTVGAPFTWSQTVSANGNGWQELLQAIADFRIQQGAPSDEFYFGAFDPGADLNSFCGGGCVAGLGFIGDPGSEQTRAAIGLGFGGDTSTYTAVHETGHNHGRQHSPCGGASDPDPNYPYAGASIGVWGLDPRTNTLLNPSSYTDVMGYCPDPRWISGLRLREHPFLRPVARRHVDLLPARDVEPRLTSASSSRTARRRSGSIR